MKNICAPRSKSLGTCSKKSNGLCVGQLTSARYGHVVNTIEGTAEATGLRFALVVSEFNEFVTARLQAAALETLIAAGADERQLTVVRVPGAFEIPLIARTLAASRRFDAVLCLGAVIRGATPHFDFIAAEAARGIAQAGWDSGVPVIFGVLTTETVEQALERAGAAERNRGADTARTAIAMATLMRRLAARPAAPGRKPHTSTRRRVGARKTRR